jgi:hypothetical protein
MGDDTMSTIKVDNLQTTSGVGLYPNRAWINFNGTSSVYIRSDGNVSSITDTGTGRCTVTFSNSQTDANYATVACNSDSTPTSSGNQSANVNSTATGSFDLQNAGSNVIQDASIVSAITAR